MGYDIKQFRPHTGYFFFLPSHISRFKIFIKLNHAVNFEIGHRLYTIHFYEILLPSTKIVLNPLFWECGDLKKRLMFSYFFFIVRMDTIVKSGMISDPTLATFYFFPKSHAFPDLSFLPLKNLPHSMHHLSILKFDIKIIMTCLFYSCTFVMLYGKGSFH